MANPEVENIDLSSIEIWNGDFRAGTVLSGEVLVKGIIGGLNAAGKFVGYNSTDGAPVNPNMILTYAVDATAGDTAARFMINGDVNENNLVLENSPTDTLDSVVVATGLTIKETLRDFTIITKPVSELSKLDNQ